jgi:hypothetical protein
MIDLASGCVRSPEGRAAPQNGSENEVRAIEILLRECLPDLAAAEIKSEQTRRYVVEAPPVLDRDEWQREYGQNPSLPPPSLQ